MWKPSRKGNANLIKRCESFDSGSEIAGRDEQIKTIHEALTVLIVYVCGGLKHIQMKVRIMQADNKI